MFHSTCFIKRTCKCHIFHNDKACHQFLSSVCTNHKSTSRTSRCTLNKTARTEMKISNYNFPGNEKVEATLSIRLKDMKLHSSRCGKSYFKFSPNSNIPAVLDCKQRTWLALYHVTWASFCHTYSGCYGNDDMAKTCYNIQIWRNNVVCNDCTTTGYRHLLVVAGISTISVHCSPGSYYAKYYFDRNRWPELWERNSQIRDTATWLGFAVS